MDARTISGIVEGGTDDEEADPPPVDTFDYALLAGPLTIDLQTGTLPQVGGHDQIDAFVGTGAADTILGLDVESLVWTISGPDQVEVADLTFTDFENLTGVADNIDVFVVTSDGSISGTLDGGVDVLDRLLNVLDRAAARERGELAYLRAERLPMRRQLLGQASDLPRDDVADAADDGADERHDDEHSYDARHAKPGSHHSSSPVSCSSRSSSGAIGWRRTPRTTGRPHGRGGGERHTG